MSGGNMPWAKSFQFSKMIQFEFGRSYNLLKSAHVVGIGNDILLTLLAVTWELCCTTG